MESLILLAAGYLSKVPKGPTVAITIALVIAMTEVIYNTIAFELIVNTIGFHIYISIVTLMMMFLLKGVRAKVSFVVIVLCFFALVINLLSFWIDALGYDSTFFFELFIHLIFGAEVLAILSRRITDGLFRAFGQLGVFHRYLSYFDCLGGERIK